MNRYIFGLSNHKTRQWIGEQWQKYGEKNLDGFIKDILTKEGEHILPLLSGDSIEERKLIRKRYYQNLSRILSPKEINDILKSELDLVLSKMSEKE